jgi:hypothetical protein
MLCSIMLVPTHWPLQLCYPNGSNAQNANAKKNSVNTLLTMCFLRFASAAAALASAAAIRFCPNNKPVFQNANYEKKTKSPMLLLP